MVPNTCKICMRAISLSFPSLWRKLIWKMSLLVMCEILAVVVNTMTTNKKYPLRNCENLQLPIQMQLSRKQKSFSEFFVAFQESALNFKHFNKNIMGIANVFLKLQTVQDLVSPLSKKQRSRRHVDSQHVKGSQTLVKS